MFKEAFFSCSCGSLLPLGCWGQWWQVCFPEVMPFRTPGASALRSPLAGGKVKAERAQTPASLLSEGSVLNTSPDQQLPWHWGQDSRVRESG